MRSEFYFEGPLKKELREEEVRIMNEDLEDMVDKLVDVLREYYDETGYSSKGNVALSAILSSALTFITMTAPDLKTAKQRCEHLSFCLTHISNSPEFKSFFLDVMDDEGDKHDGI